MGDNWATFDSLYGDGVGSVDSSGGSSWYDGALDAVGGVVGDVVGGAENWLGQLMNFELQKEQLGYKNQLANQKAVLSTVEAEQNTGAVPSSPNYRGIDTVETFGGIDKRVLIVGAVALAAYLYIK